LPPDHKPRIALLAAPEASASVLFGLYDILSSVGTMWPDLTGAPPGEPALDVRIVAASAEPFRCTGGVLVEPAAGIADTGQVDVAIVGDIYPPADAPLGPRFAAEINWLRRMHAGGAVLASVCTGSLLLAETGLLDGRSCAGHWSFVDRFRLDYPRVRFDPALILDISSEDAGIVTAGGGTSWHHLALHVVVRYCGPQAAAQTAKIHLLASHEDGQLPFSSPPNIATDDAAIREALAWIGQNPAAANPVTQMIERSGLTPRTFARRFMAATRRRPIEYVHSIRIERARGRLEAGASLIDDIGFEVGYQDATFFRRLFKRTTGLSPAAYRRKYAAIARLA
jgi:transcriptional regulator GlxA family with amidase domain